MRAWILLSSLLVGSGWILSALHQLNRVGYLAVFGLALSAAGWHWRASPARSWEAWVRTGYKLLRRFRRPAPRLFLALALLALAAGSWYCPFDGDSNTYRIPRVFHWLAEQRWRWIHTEDIRMNIAATGFEWLAAPIILFTGTDWWVFAVNWFAYLLLPGLVFSVFTRLGVRPRVAWWWMWLLATGWCYAWQAQTAINDSFATIYALAAVDFALRARQNGRLGDWWLAMLAAALLTGVKQTDIPLALVPLIALWPGRHALMSRPAATAVVVAVALLISIVPVSVLNCRHTGDWMGAMSKDKQWANCSLPNPFWGVAGNALCLTAQNLMPPVFPMAAEWNGNMRHFLSTPWGAHFRSFETFGYLEHAANANSAGIGLFVCGAVLVSIAWAFWRRHSPAARPQARADKLIVLLWLAPWVSLLAFMAKVGSFQNARQLAPYYVFLLPVLLAGFSQAVLVRKIWWQRLAIGIGLGTALMIVVSRSCPLFPARTIFAFLHQKYPESHAFAELLGSYSCHDLATLQRGAFQADMPPDEKIIGYYTSVQGLAEPAHWEPFGARRVERLVTGEPPARVRSLGIHYVMVDGARLPEVGQTLQNWLNVYDAEEISQVLLRPHIDAPAVTLYLVRLRPHRLGQAGSMNGSPRIIQLAEDGFNPKSEIRRVEMS